MDIHHYCLGDISDILQERLWEIGCHVRIPKGHPPHWAGHSVYISDPGDFILHYLGERQSCHHGPHHNIGWPCVMGASMEAREGGSLIRQTTTSLKPGGSATTGLAIGTPMMMLIQNPLPWAFCALQPASASPFFLQSSGYGHATLICPESEGPILLGSLVVWHVSPLSSQEVATWILLLLFFHLPWDRGVSGSLPGLLKVTIKLASSSVGSYEAVDTATSSLACSSTVAIRTSSSLASLPISYSSMGVSNLLARAISSPLLIFLWNGRDSWLPHLDIHQLLGGGSWQGLHQTRSLGSALLGAPAGVSSLPGLHHP